MTEKTEWEVVDAPADATSGARGPRMALIDPWWKWKLAAVAALAMLVFAFFAMLVGVAAVAIAALAVAVAGVRKLMHWLRRDGRNVDVMKV